MRRAAAATEHPRTLQGRDQRSQHIHVCARRVRVGGVAAGSQPHSDSTEHGKPK